MFHSRNGLFFHATGQGNVRIIKTNDGKEPVSCLAANPDRVETNIVCDVTLPENEWASVVSSVSKEGETASRWNQARRFHGTEIPIPAAPEEKLTAEDEEWMNAPMGTPKGKLNAVATVAPIKTEPDTTNFPDFGVCDRCGGDGMIEYNDGDGSDWGEDCPSEINHLITCRACNGTGKHR